jgi:hypothetical protein
MQFLIILPMLFAVITTRAQSLTSKQIKDAFSYNLSQFDSLMLSNGFRKGDSHIGNDDEVKSHIYFSKTSNKVTRDFYDYGTVYFNISDKSVFSIGYSSCSHKPFKKILHSIKKTGFKRIRKGNKDYVPVSKRHISRDNLFLLSVDNTLIRDGNKYKNSNYSLWLKRNKVK